MKKRTFIIVGILLFTFVLLAVPLVLAGDGSASFSYNTTAVDAEPVENSPAQGTISITHSLSQDVIAGNSVSCNAGGLHADNSYIRRFTLTDFGINGDFLVTDLEIGIEAATAGAGGAQPATINLYTWDPNTTFVFANFSPVSSANVNVPDAAVTKMMFPISGAVPAGSTLVVEFFTPDGQAAGHSLFVGSNPSGQTDATFLAAAACGVTEPTDTAGIGFPDMHLVMNVYGEEIGISFDKTVGLDANTCAATDEISVPAGMGGTDVTYCYTMMNTGSVTVTYHTVDDDQLGTLLGPGFPANVAPGAAVYFTVTTMITETTVNVGTWTITDEAGAPIISDTDVATVTQQAPTGVALSGFEVDSSGALLPAVFVVLVAAILGAGVILQRRTRA